MSLPERQRAAPNRDLPRIQLFSQREQLRNVLVVGLLQCRYLVADSSTVYATVQNVTQALPSLVIIDITAQNTKGVMIAKIMARSEKTRSIPILALIPGQPADLVARLSSEYDMDKECGKGGCHIMTYPFSFSQLVGKIDEILGG